MFKMYVPEFKYIYNYNSNKIRNKLNLKISKANYLHTHVKKEIAQPFTHLA